MHDNDLMSWRIFSFLVFLLAGAAAGWDARGTEGAIVAVMLASLAWFVWDLMRALRVLRWLRQGDASNAPSTWGVWGEVVERVRRHMRRSHQLVVESDRRLQDFLAAIQASPNGVVLLDGTGRIEWCNQTAADHFGFDPQRDLLQWIGNLVRDPEFAAYFSEGNFHRELLMSGRRHTMSRPVRLSVQVHPYGDGRKLLLSRDVTALEQADAMRRDFVANVSHEIRTPLTVLAGFVETLQTLSLEPADQKRYLGLMAQQAHRMQTLVDDLLTLSRLEGSPSPGLSERVAVARLMAECEALARELSEQVCRGQDLRHELKFLPGPAESQDEEIAGAPTEILSAMSNLVANAVRYTPPGGLVEVSWQRLPDGSAEFAVRDSGPGIAPEHLPRLTERFYRVDRSRSRETGGTGLGLAIVKHVAQRHGMELQIQSEVGKGSGFVLRIPLQRLSPVGVRDAAGSPPATEGWPG